jgi:hypothetical protein
MHNQQVSAPKNARLEALIAKHKTLSKKIEQKQIIPSVSDQEIGGLKREKLKIKEEIEGIRKAS